MADYRSGSVQTSSKIVTRGSRYLLLQWGQTRRLDKNESRIDWVLKADGTAPGYVMGGPIIVKIDGKTVYSNSSRIELRQGDEVAEGSTIVPHNSDGTKSLRVEVSAAIYDGAINVQGSQTFTITPIPERPNIYADFNAYLKDYCTIRIYNDIGEYNSSDTIYHDIYYTLYRDYDKTEELASGKVAEGFKGSTLRWELPSTWPKLMWNTDEAYCVLDFDSYLETPEAGTEKLWEPEVLFRVNASQALAPIITDIEIYNEDPTTVPLVGGNAFVLGQDFVTVRCKAEGQEDAIIESIRVYSGSLESSTGNEGEYFYVRTPLSSEFEFYVRDSRGISTTQTVEFTGHDYTLPSITLDYANVDLNPDNISEVQIVASISGTGYKGTIGSADNDPTVEFTIVCENTEETFTVPCPKPLQWSNEIDGAYRSFVCNDIAVYLADPNSTYRVKATIKDLVKPSGIDSEESVVSHTPVYDYSGTDFNLNVPLYYNNKPYIKIDHTNEGYDTKWVCLTVQDTFVDLLGSVEFNKITIEYDEDTGKCCTDTKEIRLPINIDLMSSPYSFDVKLSTWNWNNEPLCNIVVRPVDVDLRPAQYGTPTISFKMEADAVEIYRDIVDIIVFAHIRIAGLKESEDNIFDIET